MISYILTADHLKRIIASLVDASVYFEVTPLPDDYYEIRVKEDVRHVLDEKIALIG